MEFKTYISPATAKKAIAKAGLGQMDVRYDPLMSGRTMPVVLCDLSVDAREVMSRGFKAEVKHTMFGEGATVFLKDKVPAAKRGELAKVIQYVPTQEGSGGVKLDRPIGGTRYWSIDDLELISREVEL